MMNAIEPWTRWPRAMSPTTLAYPAATMRGGVTRPSSRRQNDLWSAISAVVTTKCTDRQLGPAYGPGAQPGRLASIASTTSGASGSTMGRNR
jgi:hypothetical protein